MWRHLANELHCLPAQRLLMSSMQKLTNSRI